MNFRIFLFLLIHIFVASSFASEDLETISRNDDEILKLKGKGQVYLKPENKFVTITNDENPKATYSDCKEHPEKKWCIGWPDKDSDIKLVSDESIKIGLTEEGSGKPYFEFLVKVRVKYTRTNQKTGEAIQVDKTGWINTKYLSKSPSKEIFKSLSPAEKFISGKSGVDSSCSNSDKKPKEPRTKNLNDIKKLTDFISPTGLDEAVQEVNKFAGFCAINPANDKMRFFNKWINKNVYDEEVLSKANQFLFKEGLPKVKGENGQISKNQLLKIDALARTIYAEMNSCSESSLEYPMAVAKVALNRESCRDNQKYLEKKEIEIQENEKILRKLAGIKTKKAKNAVFAAEARIKTLKNPNYKPENLLCPKSDFYRDEKQNSSKPDLVKLLVADKQFSCWNNNNNQDDKTLLMSLCPIKKKQSERNWKGTKTPSDQEVDIWENSLKVATEAILFPSIFKDKTKQITQKYYTSKMTSYQKRKRAKPQIMGRTVSSFNCMYLWDGN